MDFFDRFSQNILGDSKKRVVNKDFEEVAFSEDEPLLVDEKAKRNFLPLYILALIVFIFLISKLWILQVVQGAHYRYLSEGNRIRIKEIPASRGVIYTSDGLQLVSNAPSFLLEIIPQDLPANKDKREEILKKVSEIVSIPYPDLVAKTREIEAEPTILKQNIERSEALILKEKLADIPGFVVEESATRKYLSDSAFSHLLGYVGKINKEEYQQLKDAGYTMADLVGKTGLEGFYENILKGQNGKKQVEVDATGKVTRILAQSAPISGNNLVLSIDSGLQKKMAEVLGNALTQAKSPGGSAVAINPQTGAILGMVSLPSYDNNIFTKQTPDDFQKQYQQLINDPKKPLYNRAIAGIYPPGSTIKMLVAAAGLQEKIISVNTWLNAPEAILIPNKYDPSVVYRFPDWKPGGHGNVNVISAIAKSCDVFFYAVGGGYQNIKGLGIDKLYQYFKKFGLGEKTGIDLPGENAGLAPNPDWKQSAKKEPWFFGDTYHVSIGQGDLLVTPIQLVNYIAAIANGGTLLQPHLVWKIQDGEGNVIKEFGRAVKAENLVDKANVEIVRQGMKAAVDSGTARILANLPVAAAGKTGTAQFDNNNQAHAWFAAFAPYDNPQIALVVLVEGGGEGYKVAGPVADEILQYYFSKK